MKNNTMASSAKTALTFSPADPFYTKTKLNCRTVPHFPNINPDITCPSIDKIKDSARASGVYL